MNELTNEDLMRRVFVGGKEYEAVKTEIMARLQDGRAELVAPSASIADTAKDMPHGAWKPAFDERHEFDVYPEHFMSGMRNEFAAGWHAALKAIAKEPK